MRYFGSADNEQLNPRTFIEELEHKTEPLQLITLIHEAQCEDLVEIVPETIASRRLHPTEGMALAWLLQQQTCAITSLKLGGLDSHMMMQLCDGLVRHKLLQELRLEHHWLHRKICCLLAGGSFCERMAENHAILESPRKNEQVERHQSSNHA
ncbi:hypothetical protein LSAT2_015639 [Lamellibrachia satsuma]|nr:hypothetical protein LSAT2_015639 [Lamellibrachia satsuma]